MPFPDILQDNRPFGTPIFALAVHLGITVLFICAPPAGDAFNFIVSLSSYPMTFLLTLISIGLVKIRLTEKGSWRSPFTTPWVVIGVYLAGNFVRSGSPDCHPTQILVLTWLTVLAYHALRAAAGWERQHELAILAEPYRGVGDIVSRCAVLHSPVRRASVGVWIHTGSGGG
jgi:amino acid transporter